jgi:hypothetical protein
MLKQLFFSFLLILISISAAAQRNFFLKGLIFRTATSQRIAKVSIENITLKKLVYSDDWGNFSIEAHIGDTLVFKKEGFSELEKVIAVKQNLIIYLNAAQVLAEVVVKEQSKKLEQQEILNGYRSKGVFYNGNPPLLVYIFSPLTALNELIGKDANNAKRFGNYVSRENAESNVDTHFNPTIIKTAIKIKDNELAEFMYLHRPKPEQVIYWNYYDDLAYVKKAYQVYLKRKK